MKFKTKVGLAIIPILIIVGMAMYVTVMVVSGNMEVRP